MQKPFDNRSSKQSKVNYIRVMRVSRCREKYVDLLYCAFGAHFFGTVCVTSLDDRNTEKEPSRKS